MNTTDSSPYKVYLNLKLKFLLNKNLGYAPIYNYNMTNMRTGLLIDLRVQKLCKEEISKNYTVKPLNTTHPRKFIYYLKVYAIQRGNKMKKYFDISKKMWKCPLREVLLYRRSELYVLDIINCRDI